MKIRRSGLAHSLVLLVLATMGGLAWSASGILAGPLTSNINLPIAGTVNGATEKVAVSGRVQIASTFVLDDLLVEPPREVISIRLVKVTGVGLSTGATYTVTGQTVLVRPLVLSDVVELTFPLVPDAAGHAAEARSVLAPLTLKFDVLRGALTGGTARFSTPSFPG